MYGYNCGISPALGLAHVFPAPCDLAVSQGASLRQRVLHLEIADDKDPFFLHSLTVGETEFVDLAAEQVRLSKRGTQPAIHSAGEATGVHCKTHRRHDLQSILVDFAAFPAKLVELLEACVAHKHEATPK